MVLFTHVICHFHVYQRTCDIDTLSWPRCLLYVIFIVLIRGKIIHV